MPRPSPKPPTPARTIAASPRRPVSVAITGGIGAGKSELLRAFAQHGAAVISSDEIVHRLLREDEAVQRAIVERLGEGVLDESGEIVRSRVADLVFTDREKLLWLEALLHPRVVATYLGWREDLRRLDDPPAVCVTEVPLLYEVGGEKEFDAVVAVTAAPEIRAARLGRSLLEREARLVPQEEKAARADFAFVNDGSLDALDAFAADVVATLAARS
jgi:dephospho-CoA kinase